LGDHHWAAADLGRDPTAQRNPSEWLLILIGVLSVVLGIALIAQPGAGALALVWLIGWFAILEGCIFVALAFRLKQPRALSCAEAAGVPMELGMLLVTHGESWSAFSPGSALKTHQ
jgi:hypothetical protein